MIRKSSGIHAERNAFVKFFGEPEKSYKRTMRTYDVLAWSGCHWACTYPRPVRCIKSGDTIFFAQIVDPEFSLPKERIIFGRALALSHDDQIDIATVEDIKLRAWKKRWKYYVHVYQCEFLEGSLTNGVYLSELMDSLGPSCFASTKTNLKSGKGNIIPRKSLNQQTQMRLSDEGLSWMNGKLDEAFNRYGKLSEVQLRKFDYPESHLMRIC